MTGTTEATASDGRPADERAPTTDVLNSAGPSKGAIEDRAALEEIGLVVASGGDFDVGRLASIDDNRPGSLDGNADVTTMTVSDGLNDNGSVVASGGGLNAEFATTLDSELKIDTTLDAGPTLDDDCRDAGRAGNGLEDIAIVAGLMVKDRRPLNEDTNDKVRAADGTIVAVMLGKRIADVFADGTIRELADAEASDVEELVELVELFGSIAGKLSDLIISAACARMSDR